MAQNYILKRCMITRENGDEIAVLTDTRKCLKIIETKAFMRNIL